ARGHRRRRQRAAHRAALLLRARVSRLAGAGHRHGLGWPAEGGVLVRRPLRHRAAVDRMGRHRRDGRERARRRRPRPDRGGRRDRDDADRTPDALRRRARIGADRRGAPRYDPRPMKRDVAIVGAGYVGVPLARVFAEAGSKVVLVDVQQSRVDQLNAGESYIEDVTSEELQTIVGDGRLVATTDYDELRDTDAILVALPTPLSRRREPDLTILLSAAEEIATRLRPGHVVVLESTTYPGTTREKVQPILEAGSGLRAGKDFHLAFSPERVDPGRGDWTTKNVPKVVGG